MSMPATRHRFTVDDWHQMIEAGVLHEDQRLELLDGEIFEMTPIGPLHSSVVNRLTRLWVTRLGTRAIVQVQNPVEARPRSEPQPDLTLLRERADFYRDRHPGPGDVLLVIEVADTSLDYDRAKLAIYASAGIAEVWIVDLQAERVDVHRDAGTSGFGDVRAARRGDSVACRAFPDVVLNVTDILG
ncbi:MAG: Uma2 family endonuclease [Candidatus Rokubacteria bacterium]|nr:Uma2 family endonuclease [Candidatus Rokubacteria bacterium]